MQLTVRDASKFLKVSEPTVTRWIKQRGLPTRHVGGQYRFNRVELLEWATANRIAVSAEAFDDLRADDEPSPSLVAALEAGGIFHGIKNSDKEHALRALVATLPLPDGVDRELLLRLFLAREASASTAIGDGIACPTSATPSFFMSCSQWLLCASSSTPSISAHSTENPCMCSSRWFAPPCVAIFRFSRDYRSPCRTRSSSAL